MLSSSQRVMMYQTFGVNPPFTQEPAEEKKERSIVLPRERVHRGTSYIILALLVKTHVIQLEAPVILEAGFSSVQINNLLKVTWSLENHTPKITGSSKQFMGLLPEKTMDYNDVPLCIFSLGRTTFLWFSSSVGL